MSNTATIEIPRLENERAERYQARTLYTTMGPDRNLRAVAQKLDKSLTIVGRWSTEDDWPRLAAAYDQMLGNLAARDAAETYRADLEAHRKKAMDAGRSLFQVAGQLLQQVNTALVNPRRIKGEDGKVYALHGIDLNSNSLAVAARALTAALDLEAHALQIDKILPTLGTDDSE